MAWNFVCDLWVTNKSPWYQIYKSYIYIYIYIYHYQVALKARISLILSLHLSLVSISPGRSSKLHPASAQS